jgi:hypothetical protein
MGNPGKEGGSSIDEVGEEKKPDVQEGARRATEVGETFVLERARIMFANDLMRESHKFPPSLPKGVTNEPTVEREGGVSNLSNL